MKPANTRIQTVAPVIPPKPKQGDVPACKAFAQYKAQRSQNPNATRASLWVRFIKWSYLNNAPAKAPYTGWKQQQRMLQQLKGGKPNVC